MPSHGFILHSPLLTRDEAAERLRVTCRRIDDERRAGRIVPVRIGNEYRFTLADLDDYVARQRLVPEDGSEQQPAYSDTDEQIPDASRMARTA